MVMGSRLPAVIIVGMDSITALQTAGIFAERGVPVIGVDEYGDNPYNKSRAYHKKYLVEKKDLVDWLEDYDAQEKPVLLPTSDDYVFQLSINRERLDGFHLALPSHKTLEQLMNKDTFHQNALDNGFKVPATYKIQNLAQANKAIEKIRFPCVLKPDRKTVEWMNLVNSKVLFLKTPQEFKRALNRVGRLNSTLIIQEWIPGPDSNLYSCNGYFNKQSQPLVTFTARKLRQWPPYLGISSLGEECINPIILEAFTRLFSGAEYWGLCYLEMKKDQRDGCYYIIEPNLGRPTGRSAIAEAGGVELLYTMYCDLIGLPLPEQRVQKYLDTKWIHLQGDLLSAYFHFKNRETRMPQIVSSWRGKKAYAVFSWTDPLPFFHEVSYGIQNVKRAARGLNASIRVCDA